MSFDLAGLGGGGRVEYVCPYVYARVHGEAQVGGGMVPCLASLVCEFLVSASRVRNYIWVTTPAHLLT